MKELVTVSEPRPVLVGSGLLTAVDAMPVSLPDPSGSQMRARKKRRPYLIPKFDDIYEPTGENLGRGSHGNVQSFRKRSTRKEYAVKVIEKTFCDRNKVLKEVEIFHHCQGHKNIVSLVEFVEESEYYYLVFDKIRGGNLLENIHSRGFLTESDASRIVKELAGALHFLHNKGIAHRDLKPENILCESEKLLGPIKLIDFDLGSDIRRQQQEEALSTPELMTPVGSAEYMAPEVVDAWVGEASSYDKKCDVWSLGIILYIMLSGSPPFYAKCGEDCGWDRGEPCTECQDILFRRIRAGHYEFPEREWGHISKGAKDLIRKLLVRNPLDRYSAADILEHPWITNEVPQTLLATPQLLGGSMSRSSQVLDVLFSENVSTFHRLMLSTNGCSAQEEEVDVFDEQREAPEEYSAFDDEPTSTKSSSVTEPESSPSTSPRFFIGDTPEEAAMEAKEAFLGFDESPPSSLERSAPIAIKRAGRGADFSMNESVGFASGSGEPPVVKLSPPCSSLAMRRRHNSSVSLSNSQE